MVLSPAMAVRRSEHLASRARHFAGPSPLNGAPRIVASDEIIVEKPERDPLWFKQGLGDNLTLADIKLKAYFGSLPTKEVDV